MNNVSVNLQNCYGIKSLTYNFDFSNKQAFAIYAPNGAMKSSFALTFNDLSNGNLPKDRIFPDRCTLANVYGDGGAPIAGDRILVILSYDEEFGPSEKTCTLLVDQKLRAKFTEIQELVDNAKNDLLDVLLQQSKSKSDLEKEISLAIMRTPNEFSSAIFRIRDEIKHLKAPLFADVEYDRIFSEAILTELNSKNLKDLILEYVTRYYELLAASTFFRKGIFDYYNAEQISGSLAKNGFFDASHLVVLKSGDEIREINSQDELKTVIEEEKQAILDDPQLIKNFNNVQKQLSRNAGLRNFRDYLMDNMFLLPHLSNLDKFKQDVIKSYIKNHENIYSHLIETYEKVRESKEDIYAEARNQRTQWERVIDIFNNRFKVPFTLSVKNRVEVVVGNTELLELGFTYEDGIDSAVIERNDLLKYLSNGERKAFYILNVIFEIERRKKDAQETLIVFDDIADSFDYQNKYAIVEYLKEINQEGIFKQIILTHNFDFLRTVQSRFVGYAGCLMSLKSDHEVTLIQAEGIKKYFC